VTFSSGVVTYHVAEVHGEDSGYAETVLAADNSASVKIADGPRPESILLNDLIVTHFESWTLCDARAVALFVGEPRFRAIGGAVVARLTEIVEQLESGAVTRVGMLPSCVRIELAHLSHLVILQRNVLEAMASLGPSEDDEDEDEPQMQEQLGT